MQRLGLSDRVTVEGCNAGKLHPLQKTKDTSTKILAVYSTTNPACVLLVILTSAKLALADIQRACSDPVPTVNREGGYRQSPGGSGWLPGS